MIKNSDSLEYYLIFKKLAKKFMLSIFLVFILLLIFWGFLAFSDQNPAVKGGASFKAAGRTISLEAVSSPAGLYKGLSGRSGLDLDSGMLFIFSESAERSFVMRNMNFPLDIIYLSSGRIIKIYRNLPPEGGSPQQQYSSGGPADAVVELNAGQAAALGLEEGGQLSIMMNK